MTDFCTRIAKLAHEVPALRRHLVPLLRTAADPPWAEGKKFKNPETGNEVAFGSLPAEEQKKLREKNEGKGEEGGGESPEEKKKREKALEDVEYDLDESLQSAWSTTDAPDLAREVRTNLSRFLASPGQEGSIPFKKMKLDALSEFYEGRGYERKSNSPEEMVELGNRVVKDLDTVMKRMEEGKDQTGGEVPEKYKSKVNELKRTVQNQVQKVKDQAAKRDTLKNPPKKTGSGRRQG